MNETGNKRDGRETQTSLTGKEEGNRNQKDLLRKKDERRQKQRGLRDIQRQ